MLVELTKGHGSGNDFFIIDEITNDYNFTEAQRADLARVLCDRKLGLGADGILFVMNSETADGRMRVFNADGSEASMCGNGLRLVARYLCEQQGKESAVVETMKANLKVAKQSEIYPEVQTYQVEISPVLFDLKSLPLNLNKPTLYNERIPELSGNLRFTALAVPNPHLIAIVETEQLEDGTQKQISEYVNGPNELFPDGVNVSFVRPLRQGSIYVRTFERGVGFTNACGTAMSASSLVTCLQEINPLETAIEVYNDGGKVECIVHKDDKYHIDLIGNATYLYHARVKVDLQQKTFELIEKSELSEEKIYKHLQNEVQEFLNDNLKG